jgi:hypothetical protein
MFALQQIFILSLVKMEGLTNRAEKCTLSSSTAAMLTNAAYKYKNMEENETVFMFSIILSNNN